MGVKDLKGDLKGGLVEHNMWILVHGRTLGIAASVFLHSIAARQPEAVLAGDFRGVVLEFMAFVEQFVIHGASAVVVYDGRMSYAPKAAVAAKNKARVAAHSPNDASQGRGSGRGGRRHRRGEARQGCVGTGRLAVRKLRSARLAALAG